MKHAAGIMNIWVFLSRILLIDTERKKVNAVPPDHLGGNPTQTLILIPSLILMMNVMIVVTWLVNTMTMDDVPTTTDCLLQVPFS